MQFSGPDDIEVVDLRGLKCPLPALFARRTMLACGQGEMLVVVTDDPMAAVDIPHMCWQEGFEVVASQSRDGGTAITLRKP